MCRQCDRLTQTFSSAVTRSSLAGCQIKALHYDRGETHTTIVNAFLKTAKYLLYIKFSKSPSSSQENVPCIIKSSEHVFDTSIVCK